MSARSVLLTGGTGFIGGHLIRALRARGDSVWVWTRDVARARRRLPADVYAVDSLAHIPADTPIDAVVNLAGAPVIGPPWTRSRRRLLVESRVQTTQAVIAWCAQRAAKPAVMVSASAIGYYGPRGEQWLDEQSPPQPVFQSQLCVARERATEPAAALAMRVVNARIGLVLAADGGILERLALAARWRGAAVIGDGRQWQSWIHVADLIGFFERALADAAWNGAYNVVAPNPVRQRDFERTLTRVLQRPLLLRIPAALLRLALGEMAELLVDGQRVKPARLLAAGFDFRYPELEAALMNLFKRERF